MGWDWAFVAEIMPTLLAGVAADLFGVERIAGFGRKRHMSRGILKGGT